MKALLERGTAEKSLLVSLLVDEIAKPDTHDSRRVGFTLSMDYSEALVMVHDKWRSDVEGIPHNSYLLAATFNPADFAAAQPVGRRVILLRVTGRAPIETDSEHLRAITQFFQDNPDVKNGRLEELEPITVNRMSWTGMKGHILGTFFVGQDGELRMGTDIEDVFATRMMRVYKPTAKALRTIVNYVDPDRRKKAEEDATAAGVGIPIPFQIGTVRYTSTQHMAERGGSTDVPVYISAVDFLARRTAVFGMTRTGKSNTTKTMVSQVATTAFQTRQPIGQLIFDINGEYSNANQQDQGSAINDVFPDMTVRYRIMSTPGFRDLRTNFYNDLPMALELIGHEIEQQGRSSGGNDLKNFLSMNLDRPAQSDHSEWNHWLRRASIFRAILLSAGYRPDSQNAARQEIEIGKDVLADIVRKGLISNKLDASQLGSLPEKPTADALADACRAYFGLERVGTGSRHVASLEDMRTFWRAAREIEMAGPLGIFGEPAKLHKPMMKMIADVRCRVNGLPPLVMGVTKSGRVVEHGKLIQPLLLEHFPRGRTVLIPISDEYRYRYIDFGAKNPDSNFGNDTHYGQAFLVRSANDRIFEVNIAYPFAEKGADFQNRKVELDAYGADIGRAIGILELFETELYADANIVQHLAHRCASISHRPAGRTLDMFVRSIIGA